ncbi:MAG TPA: aminotransferase class V-fold PLP-dependent enzyme [Magnetospirillaceae bacterium]
MAVELFVPTFAIDECLEGIRECLERGWTGSGFKTIEFENAWKNYTGHATAHFLSSATAGLHLAVNILKEIHGWENGDEVITTPLTFVSTNHAILYENLSPVFADVDEFLCLDPAEVEKRIGPRTRAVMFVGLGGNAGRFAEIKALCKARGLSLILDAAHMAGTRVDGAIPDADAVVYSFHAVKNLPTADSGMICFPDPEIDAIARRKAWLGISADTYSRNTGQSPGRWYYDVGDLGWKYHGNSIMAAIGLVGLRHLDEANTRRREIAGWYLDALGGNSRIDCVPTAPGCLSAQHLFQVMVDRRDDVIQAMNRDGVSPGVHYRDNRDYALYAHVAGAAPRARTAAGRLISLPLHLRLSRADVDAVVLSLTRHV